LIWLHWDLVKLACVVVPLVAVLAAMRIAGLSWLWASLAAAATAVVTYLAARALFDRWVLECLAENRTPPPPPSWPWSPRREFCDPGSGAALGGFATLAAPTLLALAAAVLARTRLRPIGLALLAALIPMPLLPDFYVTSLPYYRTDQYPILHDPVLIPTSEDRPARACYEYGIAQGPRESHVVRPDDRRTCVEFERTPAAEALTYSYDEGRTEYDLDWVGKKLTEKGLPPEPGDTGVDGLVVSRAFELTFEQLMRLNARARQTDRRAASLQPAEPADCRGGLARDDPPDDVADSGRVLLPRGRPAADRRADLRALRLRSDGRRVCVAYEMGGDVSGPMRFTFELRDSEDPRAFTQIFTARVAADNEVRVTSGADERGPLYVPAEIGLRGRLFTLVLDDRSFEEGQPGPPSQPIAPTGTLPPTPRDDPPLDQFAFIATVTVPLAGQRRLRDYFGPLASPRAHGYPGGRPCLSDSVCFSPPRRPMTRVARRMRRALEAKCSRVGGRVGPSPRAPTEDTCIVHYGGVPYEALVPEGRQFDATIVRDQHRLCREAAHSLLRDARGIVEGTHKPLRVDYFIWHPQTLVCEVRPRGRLLRPR
jgi:hypothetical protein